MSGLAYLVGFVCAVATAYALTMRERIRLHEARVNALDKRLDGFFEELQTVIRPYLQRAQAGKHDTSEHKMRPEEVASQIGFAISSAMSQIPPLERVISFSMWMTRDFTRETVGITDAELGEIKDQVATVKFWPAISITLQLWTTHTVVFDHSGYRFTMYEPLPWFASHWTKLWSHTFGSQVKGPTADGALEIVFHENTIKCWGRWGRFESKWSGEAEEKNIFISIPLKEPQLQQYLRPDEKNDDPELSYKSTSSYREYSHTDARGFGWDLVIRKMAGARD